MIYFKDVQSVIFSMLASMIVFILYILFLKDTFVDAIESSMTGLEQLVKAADIDMLANGLLLAGILGSAMITVPYNCLSTIVRDQENKIDYDISATPMKRWQIILSYFTASVISAFLMSSVILTVGTGILSAATGFVIGAYIPIFQFSEGVQTFCNLFPASCVTILFRRALLGGLLDHMNSDIGGVDQGLFVERLKEIFTFQANVFEQKVSVDWTVLYVLGFTVVCIVVMAAIYSKIYKRK